MRQRVDQRGFSLITVLVVLLLSLLLAFWSLRTLHLQEILTGNDGDYQRALQAAHAALRDAEFDLRGERADGTPCGRDAPPPCRVPTYDAVAGLAFTPGSVDDLRALEQQVAGRTPACIAGICTAEALPAEFWKRDGGATGLAAMKRVAATYGQFTGAGTGAHGSPLLRVDPGRAPSTWYWIEVLPYDSGAAAQGARAMRFAPDAERPFLYRITALAQGLKPGTQAVVQSIVVWRKVDS